MVDVHLNWLNWFNFLILKVGLPVILIDCIIFLSPFLDITTISNSFFNSFFPLTARLWNSLPIECFPLTYDLNGFKCRNNRHINCRSFLKRFPVSLNPFVLLFLVTSCLLVAVQPYMEGILKKRVVLVVFNKIYFLHICLTSFLFESKFFSFPICHSFSSCLIIVLSIIQTLMIIIVTISGIIFAVTDVLVLLLSVLFLLYIS